MFLSPRTVGVLATVVASLATAGPAAAEPTPPPTITSVAVNGADLHSQDGTFYTNDTTDVGEVTVTGDPLATSIDLLSPSEPQPRVGGVATFTIPAFSHGWAELQASQTDEGGTQTLGPVSVVQADVVPTLEGINGDNGGEGPEPYAANDLHFGATSAIPGDPVELFIDDNHTPIATADANDVDGSVESFDLNSPVSVGYHTVYVKSVDDDGNKSTGSTPAGIYVRPASPTITSPASTPDNDAYVNTSPNITVTGVAGGATVDLYELDSSGSSGASLASVTSDSGGTVTLTPSPAVAPGFHRFVVTQTVTEDPDGAPRPVSSNWFDELGAETNVNFVTAAPELHSDVENNPYSSSSQPRFNARVPGVGSPRIRFIDAKSGQTLGEGGQYGDWTPSAPLADGGYSVYAVAIDDLGHSSAHSTPVDFTIDTLAPATPSFTSPTDGTIVTTHVPTITVHGDVGTDMCLAVDLAPEAQEADVVCQTADANGNATMTPNMVLADGPHSLSVSSQDNALNTSYARETITVKTASNSVPPVQTTVTPVHPTLTSVKLSSHTVSAGHPVKVGFKVDKPGTVTITLTKKITTMVKQKVKIKVKGKTTVVTKTVNTTVIKVVGTVKVQVKKAGQGNYTLTTKFGGHKLGKGDYTVSLKTGSGKSQSKPVSQTLSVR